MCIRAGVRGLSGKKFQLALTNNRAPERIPGLFFDRHPVQPIQSSQTSQELSHAQVDLKT